MCALSSSSCDTLASRSARSHCNAATRAVAEDVSTGSDIVASSTRGCKQLRLTGYTTTEEQDCRVGAASETLQLEGRSWQELECVKYLRILTINADNDLLDSLQYLRGGHSGRGSTVRAEQSPTGPA